MTIEGPDGKLLYTPFKAYRRIGKHLYGSKWDTPPPCREPLPHPPAAVMALESGGERAEKIKEHGDPNSDDYKHRQIRSYRAHHVIEKLQGTLSAGKATAWKLVTGRWKPIYSDEWLAESIYFEELFADIENQCIHSKPSSNKIGIDCEQFDDWVVQIKKSVIDRKVPPGQTREPGRPFTYDWKLFKDELKRRDWATTLPVEHIGFRVAICRMLRDWFVETHNNENPPELDTIQRKLNYELNCIQEEYYGGK